MKKTILISALITLISYVSCLSQTATDSVFIETNNEIKGLVLDFDKHTPLPYANIYVLHKNTGVISNEKGCFLMNIDGLEKTDTLRFQYIGYETKILVISQLDASSVVYLKEDIINLTETLIFGSAPSAKSIVKKVLENKDSNYRKTTNRNLTFIRERNTNKINQVEFDLKKSSISQLDKEMIKLVEDNIPRETISYNDFLGNIYRSNNPDDSIKFKTDPIKAVSLKEKEIAELDQIETVFEDVYKDIGDEEYWKIKSGIFSQKIDEEENSEPSNDTLQGNEEAKKDTVKPSGRKLKYFNRRVNSSLSYSLLHDKDSWEFLHSTGKYNYTLVGGTRVNGEDVYIIEFTPRNSGKFVGKIYISLNTYALIRADYEFAEGKTGRNFNMFGIGYTENYFTGSIYFERVGDNYVLKYLSKKTGFSASFDRNIAMVKKKKRFLFDKKLNEIKIGIKLAINNQESFELLFLEKEQISQEQFSNFTQKERMEVIYVDQFDDKLWKGFAIIEPTEQMREYKKQGVNLAE